MFFIILVLLAFSLSCENSKLIKSGVRIATADFGGYEFVVDSGGISVTEITFNFSNWHGTSGRVNVRRTPGWSITNRKFEIEHDLDSGVTTEDLYTIEGFFSDNGEEAGGTCTESINGTTSYSKTWEGEWTGSSAFTFK